MPIFNHYLRKSFSAYFDQTLPGNFFDRLIGLTNGYPAYVAISNNESLAGFAFLHPYHPAPVFKRTAELTYFIVPYHTHRGLIGKIHSRLI